MSSLLARRRASMVRPPWQMRSAAARSRSSSLRNNSGQGAVVGTIGSGGDASTNWTMAGTGLAFDVVAIGLIQRLEFVDLRWYGTTGSGNGTLAFESGTQISAVSGDVVTESVLLALVGGSVANISSILLNPVSNTSGGAFVSNNQGSDFKGSLGPGLRLFSYSPTLAGGGTVARVRPMLQMLWSIGVAIDITLRVVRPMFHSGAAPLSPIRTDTAARNGVYVSAGA